MIRYQTAEDAALAGLSVLDGPTWDEPTGDPYEDDDNDLFDCHN